MSYMYDHVLPTGEAHPAFRATHRLANGEVMQSASVTWPEVEPSDGILCGSCLHQFAVNELNERVLRPREELEG